MPNGYILKDFAPRKKADVAGSGKDTNFHPEIKRTLSNVSVRQIGDSAVLVGIVTTESPKEKSQSAETVSFVKVSGQWKIASAQWTDFAKCRAAPSALITSAARSIVWKSRPIESKKAPP
jgi:hypothetical protein